MGNNEKAFFALDKAYGYSQDLNNQEAYFKLNVVEKKYELEKKEKKIKEKESEIKIQNLEIQNSAKKLWLVFTIFILTTIGVIILTYFFKRETKSNKELRALSAENDFLMAEANHRINNNLQLIVILISAQIEKLKKEESKEIQSILVKINSIATLHKHLYKIKNKKEINIEMYLKDIEHSFSNLFAENTIVSTFSVTPIYFKIDDAMYFGLMLTELYINSIKHAFNNQEDKRISFRLTVINDEVVFEFKDNGKQTKKTSLKPKLLDQLCRQLEVSYVISIKSGFEINFRKNIIPVNNN
jgi:two-component sensor histidine kinase